MDAAAIDGISCAIMFKAQLRQKADAPAPLRKAQGVHDIISIQKQFAIGISCACQALARQEQAHKG